MLQLGNLVIRHPASHSALMGNGQGKEKSGVVLCVSPLCIASLDAQTFWNNQTESDYVAVGAVWRVLLNACQKNWYTTPAGRQYLHANLHTEKTP